MGLEPSIMFGRVGHARLFPRRNRFGYGIYYLAVPLSRIDTLPLARNRLAALSLYDRDHGDRTELGLSDWANDIFADYGFDTSDSEIVLVCMPRVLGYVFNPVSFWLLQNPEGDLRAVLCEVHNTFGERHTYLCAHADRRSISRSDVLHGAKLFHVSPFLTREGGYDFTFDVSAEKLNIRIDYSDAAGRKLLVTSLSGVFQPLTRSSLRRAFRAYPLVTLKATALIHWQALKLLAKGIRFNTKPAQKPEKVAATNNVTRL